MPTDSDRLIALREFVEKRFAAMKQTCPSTPEDEHALGCTLILAEIDRLLTEPATEGKASCTKADGSGSTCFCPFCTGGIL